ncbi:MAG: phytoene/squalene synthase family protein [Pseudomonadota bacterium]
MHNSDRDTASERLSPELIKECRESIRIGSKSFYAASLVLPKEVRDAASALYAFCRLSDDLVDAQAATLETVDRLKDRLDQVYRGQPGPCSADQALYEVVERYDIPKGALLALLEGFEWDVTGRPYETFEDVLDYSARVAGTIGVMMSIIMGRREMATLARASDLGTAMQLTNIARDVGEDARNGRLYLPAQWLREEGVDPARFLADPHFSPAIGRVVNRLLGEATRIYKRSLTGLIDLPLACRPGIRAAGLVYAEIGAQIRRNGYDSVTQRAHTSRARKFGLLAQSMLQSVMLPECDLAHPIEQNAYLVDMAARPSQRDVSAGEWFMDLLYTLKCRDDAFLLQNDPQSVKATATELN